MSRLRSAAQLLGRHWLLAVALLVNLAIAAPIGAVNWNNDSCRTDDGGYEACCTTCWFFCNCDFGEGIG